MNAKNVQILLPEPTVSNESGMYVDTRLHVEPPIILMILSYLIVVLKIGPSFMKYRPAFQLKNFMIIYNIYQILACIYMGTLIYLVDLPTFKYGACAEFKPGTKVEEDFNRIASTILWLKISEFTETIVFVLRKKQKQVSFLHVFHHSTMVFMAYNYGTIYRTSSAIFPIFLNCGVHVIMYTYYLMAAVLPSNIVAKLTPIKKSITTIQMIQFTIVLLHVVVAKMHGCKIPELLLAVYLSSVIVIFYGFYDFYKKSYTAAKNNNKRL